LNFEGIGSRQLAKMDLETIQKAMEELRVAKEEIAKLQQSRLDAEKNVQKALSLVDSVKE
jgi:hypothetical protein